MTSERGRACLVLTALLATVVAAPVFAQGSIPGAPSGGRAVVTRPPFDPQDIPESDVLRRIQAIVAERPPQAEAAARAFVHHVAPHRVGTGEGPTGVPLLDELKARDVDAYWREVAQLNMQFAMLQNAVARDSVRARLMAVLFGTEFEARALQRTWRGANEAERQRIRSQLQALMTRHVAAELELRAIEIRDIRQRLAEVEAESERRRQRQADLVQWAVDDIILQAQRPDEQ